MKKPFRALPGFHWVKDGADVSMERRMHEDFTWNTDRVIDGRREVGGEIWSGTTIDVYGAMPCRPDTWADEEAEATAASRERVRAMNRALRADHEKNHGQAVLS